MMEWMKRAWTYYVAGSEQQASLEQQQASLEQQTSSSNGTSNGDSNTSGAGLEQQASSNDKGGTCTISTSSGKGGSNSTGKGDSNSNSSNNKHSNSNSNNNCGVVVSNANDDILILEIDECQSLVSAGSHFMIACGTRDYCELVVQQYTGAKHEMKKIENLAPWDVSPMKGSAAGSSQALNNNNNNNSNTNASVGTEEEDDADMPSLLPRNLGMDDDDDDDEDDDKNKPSSCNANATNTSNSTRSTNAASSGDLTYQFWAPYELSVGDEVTRLQIGYNEEDDNEAAAQDFIDLYGLDQSLLDDITITLIAHRMNRPSVEVDADVVDSPQDQQPAKTRKNKQVFSDAELAHVASEFDMRGHGHKAQKINGPDGRRRIKTIGWVRTDYTTMVGVLPKPKFRHVEAEKGEFDQTTNKGRAIYAVEDDPEIVQAMNQAHALEVPTRKSDNDAWQWLRRFYAGEIWGNWAAFKERNYDELQNLVFSMRLQYICSEGSECSQVAEDAVKKEFQDTVAKRSEAHGLTFEEACKEWNKALDTVEKLLKDAKEWRGLAEQMFDKHVQSTNDLVDKHIESTNEWRQSDERKFDKVVQQSEQIVDLMKHMLQQGYVANAVGNAGKSSATESSNSGGLSTPPKKSKAKAAPKTERTAKNRPRDQSQTKRSNSVPRGRRNVGLKSRTASAPRSRPDCGASSPSSVSSGASGASSLSPSSSVTSGASNGTNPTTSISGGSSLASPSATSVSSRGSPVSGMTRVRVLDEPGRFPPTVRGTVCTKCPVSFEKHGTFCTSHSQHIVDFTHWEWK